MFGFIRDSGSPVSCRTYTQTIPYLHLVWLTKTQVRIPTKPVDRKDILSSPSTQRLLPRSLSRVAVSNKRLELRCANVVDQEMLMIDLS